MKSWYKVLFFVYITSILFLIAFLFFKLFRSNHDNELKNLDYGHPDKTVVLEKSKVEQAKEFIENVYDRSTNVLVMKKIFRQKINRKNKDIVNILQELQRFDPHTQKMIEQNIYFSDGVGIREIKRFSSSNGKIIFYRIYNYDGTVFIEVEFDPQTGRLIKENIKNQITFFDPQTNKQIYSFPDKTGQKMISI